MRHCLPVVATVLAALILTATVAGGPPATVVKQADSLIDARGMTLSLTAPYGIMINGGCSRRSGCVSGTVTVDGRPLEYGMVNFVGAGGAASAPAGGGRRPFAPLPDRYASPGQSGLAVDVVAGDQRLDLPLTSN